MDATGYSLGPGCPLSQIFAPPGFWCFFSVVWDPQGEILHLPPLLGMGGQPNTSYVNTLEVKDQRIIFLEFLINYKPLQKTIVFQGKTIQTIVFAYIIVVAVTVGDKFLGYVKKLALLYYETWTSPLWEGKFLYLLKRKKKNVQFLSSMWVFSCVPFRNLTWQWTITSLCFCANRPCLPIPGPSSLGAKWFHHRVSFFLVTIPYPWTPSAHENDWTWRF